MSQNAVHRFVSVLIPMYLRLVYRSSRWQREGTGQRDAFLKSKEPYIILTWHSRAAMLLGFRDADQWPLAAVVSRHRDGQVVARILEASGIKPIEVSSKSRSPAAADAVLQAIRSGVGVAITPDGPRGPARTIKRGTIQLARLSGARLTMITYSVRRRLILKSWDNYILPLPFNRGVIMWSSGIVIPKRLTGDQAKALRQQVETMMNDLTDRADRMMGHPPDTDRKERKKRRLIHNKNSL